MTTKLTIILNNSCRAVLLLALLFGFPSLASGEATSINKNHSEIAAEITVSGIVTSAEDQEPLIGVNIVVKGTTMGTVSDIDGSYTIRVDENATLMFSYTGHKTCLLYTSPSPRDS